jgi:hypothetical protein
MTQKHTQAIRRPAVLKMAAMIRPSSAHALAATHAASSRSAYAEPTRCQVGSRVAEHVNYLRQQLGLRVHLFIDGEV